MQIKQTAGSPTPRKLWWELFLTFFQIGAFTIGGGYVMVPLIQEAIVDKKQWIKQEDFLDILAIAQSAPGAIAVNTAVAVGFQIGGTAGAMVATLGAVLPSFLIILVIACFFFVFRGNFFVEAFFRGVRPAVVVLLFLAAFKMGKQAIGDRAGIIIMILGLVAVAWLGIHPILAIVAAGVFGAFYYSRRGYLRNKEY